MYVFNVEVSMRKGLGPEFVEKVFVQAYDDIPAHLTIEELKSMAILDTEMELMRNEDFLHYGKTWIIKEVCSA